MATLLLILIYVAFISLGLPDAMLGAGWPTMQSNLGVSYGFAGILHMIIAGGTIVSSAFAGRVLGKFGTGKVTAFSVGLTAVALFGFSCRFSFGWLLLAAIPLGLGAGAVDAGLNAFVASHYESRHMSWLHCFWGVGALAGPLVLSAFLWRGNSWRLGYLTIAVFQTILVVVLVTAIPLWAKVCSRIPADPQQSGPLHQPFARLLALKGVKWTLATFLFYCGIEATIGLWGGSFLFKVKGLGAASAALCSSICYASITLGRFLTGFLTLRVPNATLIRAGALIVLAGVALMLVPGPLALSLAGFVLAGLGCAPIFPCLLHETPARFGEKNAQALMGLQMAIAYVGLTFLPPLFGFLAASTSLALLPVVLSAYACVLFTGTERTRRLFGK